MFALYKNDGCSGWVSLGGVVARVLVSFNESDGSVVLESCRTRHLSNASLGHPGIPVSSDAEALGNTASRIAENVGIFDFELSPADMLSLDSLTTDVDKTEAHSHWEKRIRVWGDSNGAR